MVVFTCNHCGESLQKPRVEKHYQTTCRNEIAVTCMDCFKDFKLQEYVAHIKCITEEERYSAKGTVQGGAKKGEKKQISWVAEINNIIESQKDLKPNERSLLEVISKHDNIPRKKNKFINFMQSTSGGRINLEDVEAVWSILEAQKKFTKEGKKQEGDENKIVESNEENNTEAKKSKKKKRKADSEVNSENSTDSKKKKSDPEIAENNNTEVKISKKMKRKLAKEAKDATVINETTEIPNKKKKQEVDKIEETVVNGKGSKKKKNKQKEESQAEVVENGDNLKKKGKNKKEKITEEPKEEEIVTEEKKKDGNKKNKKLNKKNKAANGVSAENGDTVVNGEKKAENGTATNGKAKKPKTEGQSEVKKPEGDPFLWNNVIIEVLKKKKSGISREDLRKKVFKIYEDKKGGTLSAKQLKSYNRRLKKIKNISLKENIFTYVDE